MERSQKPEIQSLVFLHQDKELLGDIDELRENLPELKDSTTVLYDMALRNPNDTPKGKGYYDRFRVYPQGSEAKTILEHSKILGYRIKPEYLETVSQTA